MQGKVSGCKDLNIGFPDSPDFNLDIILTIEELSSQIPLDMAAEIKWDHSMPQKSLH